MAYRTSRNRHPQDLSGLTELRVHGVGGASPEQVLDAPFTDWVAGDVKAGFFTSPSPRPENPPRRVEAYSWGGLTSRSVVRALWLLLLPFALLNLAGWMSEQRRSAVDRRAGAIGWAERISVATVRVAGLVVSATAALYTSVAAIDLFGWQCFNTVCRTESFWAWPLRVLGDDASLGSSLAVGAVVAVLVIGVVAFLTKRSQDWVQPAVAAPTTGDIDPAFRLGLKAPEFWFSTHVADRLGVAHTAATFAVIGHVLSSTVASAGMSGAIGWLPTAFVVVLAVAAVLIVGLGVFPSQAYWGVLAASVVLLGVALVSAIGGALPATGAVEAAAAVSPQAPGARDLSDLLFWVTAVAVLAFGVAQAPLVQSTANPGSRHRGFDWFAPVALLVLGAGIITSVGSGALIQISNLLGQALPLNTWQMLAERPADAIVYTSLAGSIAVNTVFTLVVMGLVAGAVAAREWSRRQSVEEVMTEYGQSGTPADKRIAGMIRRIVRAKAVARITDSVAIILGIGIGSLIILVLANLVSSGFDLNAMAPFGARLQSASAWFISLLPVGFLFLMSRSSQSAPLRRGIGIIWDVATFWPRWFHPWAPPAYGERAVPQLAQRMTAIREAGGTVILSGHSQGSAVACAALLYMAAVDDQAAAGSDEGDSSVGEPAGEAVIDESVIGESAIDESVIDESVIDESVIDAKAGHAEPRATGMVPDMPGVALVTHGSPVGRLYKRFFRRYLDEELLGQLAERLARPDRPGWINLYRNTDFIGGPVFDRARVRGYRDDLLLDPPELLIEPGLPVPTPSSHFNYTDTDAYDAVIEELSH